MRQEVEVLLCDPEAVVARRREARKGRKTTMTMPSLPHHCIKLLAFLTNESRMSPEGRTSEKETSVRSKAS